MIECVNSFFFLTFFVVIVAPAYCGEADSELAEARRHCKAGIEKD